jgi:hypothetical protein
VVNALPGADGVYNATPYRVVDALADTMAEIERLNLSHEERVDAIASVLRGAQPYRSGKAKQPAGRGGQRELRGGAGPVVEGRCDRTWLSRRGG